ncbi:O-antigen ligase family protein [Mesorhizobium sp. M1312]|uniref:O-antigen ligase family protein n=1 Tax=unclassified Mesorhizobium TaxID=325217 RepID=UPI00333C9802
MTQRTNVRYDADSTRGGIGHRLAPYVDRRILLSPATAFALAICGIYSFAGLINWFDPEGSTWSILVRLAIVLITVGSYVLLPAKVRSSTAALIPMKIFFVLYLCRLVENVYLSSISISPGPMMVFSIFLVTSVGTTLLLASMDRAIKNTDMILAMNTLCVLFLVGLYLNIDMLFLAQGERISLDKINPIAMGHTAFAFLIYFFLVLGKTKRLTIQSAILGPMLLLVVVFSRSRGAYIAGAGALLVYILLLKGSKRVFAVLGALVVAMAILATSGVELVDVVIARLQTINVDVDQSTMVRSQLFAGAWSQFLESPVFGRYAVEMRFNFYPHNIYLESLMAVGALGSLPFVAHIVLALRSTVGIIRSGKFPLAAVLAAVLFIREAIAGMASGSLWGNSLFWVTSALTISFWYGYQGFLAKNRSPKIKAYEGAY